jgi:hypothetical protein
MPQYDIEFAQKLAHIANLVVTDGTESIDAQRTVLYLSLLSTEIALKSMLEKAGTPVSKIRRRSHNLADLLTDLGRCKLRGQVEGQKAASASSLRGCTLHQGEALVSVGTVIDAEHDGASQYPNEVRYGDRLRHYSPAVVAQMASRVVAFAHEHWSNLRMS